MKQKSSKNLPKLVCVSALALLSVPLKQAHAILTIACSQNISFGTILPSCTGNVTVRATAASGTINNGCHTLVSGAIRPGTCIVSTTALPLAVSDARITFTTTQVQFSNTAGGGQVTLDNYRLQTGAGSQLNSFTYNRTLVNPTHTFKVGGRLRFDNAEPNGNYSSNVNIIVTAIP